MEKRFIVTALLITLLSVVFSMSGDGENVPVVKNESENVDNQIADNTNNEKNVPVGNNETVKDQFGIDTGMTEEQLVKFRNEFDHKAKLLGIPEGRDGYSSHYRWKTNLNKYQDLKEMGVDLKYYGVPSSYKSHLENSIYSNVVLIGEIYDIIYVDDQKFYNSIYKVRVLEVLKGKEFILDEFNGEISVPSKNGKNYSSSDATEMKVGEKRLFFLKYKLGEENRFASNSRSEMLIENDKLYSNSTNVLIGNLKTEIEKMKKVIKINDSVNFYKRSYKVEE